MTMQIGMVGTDGVLIASDTRWMNTGDVRQTSHSSKMRFNHERTVAITCARNMENALRISDNIIADLSSDEDWKSPVLEIENIARNILNAHGDPERNDAQCLIVSLRPVIQLFCLEVATVNRQAGKPHCRKIADKAVIGDRVNAAVFWTERYYKLNQTIRSLVPLAAHLLISASKLNPAGIGGLEIVLCDGSGIQRLSDPCLRDLEAKANELDESIGRSFGTYTQEFTYAPNVVS